MGHRLHLQCPPDHDSLIFHFVQAGSEFVFFKDAAAIDGSV